MRYVGWVAVGAVVLSACSPGADDTGTPDASTGTVRLTAEQVTRAGEDAGCTEVPSPGGSLSVSHIDPDEATAEELYDTRPGTAGDHLGEWVAPGVFEERPDERSVIHNHEHGAVSVWYEPDLLDARQLESLTGWATARNEAGLANEAGAGVIVSPFRDDLPEDVVVAFRSWSGGLDCAAFNEVVADGFLLDHFGQAPEGNLAPSLDGVVEVAETA